MPLALRLTGLVVRGLTITTLILLLAGAAGLVVLHARGEQLLSVQTASMVPTFRPGDALIVVPASADELQLGQVISYHSPRDPRVIISHRLIRQQAGQLTTAGDALHSPDPSFSSDHLVGRVIAIAPRLGSVLDWLHQPLGLIIAIYIPAVVVTVWEIYHLITAYRPLQYRLAGR